MGAAQTVLSLVDYGQHGLVVTIECAFSNSLPSIVIVGQADRAVDEAHKRIRSSFAASKLDLPRKRITINLAPADIPKDGSSFDLGVAAAIVAGNKQIKDPLTHTAIMGELGLGGSMALSALSFRPGTSAKLRWFQTSHSRQLQACANSLPI